MDEGPGPLAGIQIVEAGHSYALLVLGRLLTDLGATVVPVGDRPKTGTRFARWISHRDCSLGRWSDAAGLLHAANVLIYDERAEKELAAGGIETTTLSADLPQLVAVRLSPFGLTGPLAGSPATDATLQALAGLTAATGEEPDPPLLHRLALAGRTAALSGLLVIGAALIGRDRGAGGDHYDIAEFDSLITHLGTILPGVALTGKRPPRRGNRHAMAAPWNSYPCADAHVMICTMGEPMWHRLAAIVERPDLANAPQFAGSTARVADVENLDAIISRWTAQRAAADVIAAMRAARIPCGLIATPAEVRASDLAERRGLVTGRDREPHSPVASLSVRPHPDGSQRPQGGLRTRIPPTAPPLQGLRVLELGSYTAGPAAGRLLAQLGADVLKIEPLHGEGSRRLAQRLGPAGYLYFVNNAGKRSCRLDLGATADRETFEQLLADTDLLLTNLAADTLENAGIDAGRVLSRHNIVHCAVTGYGRGTANRSFDTVIQAESGIMHLVGQAAGRPCKTAVSSADVLGSYLAATAAVLATYRRLRTGHGGSADVALFDVAAWLTQDAWFGDPEPASPRILTVNDGTVVVDAEATPLPCGDTAAVATAAAKAGVPAAALLDATVVIRHPQVLARSMIVEQRYGDAHLLITGNHLRSLRRPELVLSVAPVDQNEPVWRGDRGHDTTTQKGRR